MAGGSAFVCSDEPGLHGGGLRDHPRRLCPSQSREWRHGRKVVEGKPVVVCPGARRRAWTEVSLPTTRIRHAVPTSRSLTIRRAARARGDSGHDPVHVQSADRVGVIDDECQFGCARGRRPRQRWRHVGPLAAELHRDRGAVGEHGTGDRQWLGGRAGVVASTVVAFGTYGGVSRLSPPPPPQPPSATTSASPAVANGVR